MDAAKIINSAAAKRDPRIEMLSGRRVRDPFREIRVVEIEVPPVADSGYARSYMFAKRVRLMTDRAKYCGTIPTDTDNVTPTRYYSPH